MRPTFSLLSSPKTTRRFCGWMTALALSFSSLMFAGQALAVPVAQTVITSPSDNATITGDRITFTGTSRENASFDININNQDYTVSADADGTWNLTISGLSDGAYLVTLNDAGPPPLNLSLSLNLVTTPTVPTLTEWAMMGLMGALLAAGVFVIKRRRRPA